MSASIVYFIISSALLWRCAHFAHRLSREADAEAGWQLREDQYVHLVDFSNALADELHELRHLLGGKRGVSSKRATTLAETDRSDDERQEVRKAALIVMGRFDRLGRALKIGIFSASDIWKSNGEVILAADRRLRPLFDTLQAANPNAYSGIDYLLDELRVERAKHKLAKSG